MLDGVELNSLQRSDLKKKFRMYLEEKQADYMDRGLSADAAAEEAIKDFGDSKDVGKDLLKSYFPQRRVVLLTTIILSGVFSISVFLSSVFFFGIAPVVWPLLMAGLVGLSIYFYRHPSKAAKHRGFFIGFMFPFSLVCLFSQFYLEALGHPGIRLTLSILMLLTFVSILANIVVGAIHQPINSRFRRLDQGQRFVNVLFNLISGIVVMGYATILSFGFFIFGLPPQAPVMISFVLFLIGLWLTGLIMSHFPSVTSKILQVIAVLLVFNIASVIDVIYSYL